MISLDPILQRYQVLEEKVKLNNPSANLDILSSAFRFADKEHTGQKRKDGSPYITHPIAVAEIVAEMGLDMESILAALLHDTLEDTRASYEEISRSFGPSVAELVDGVTKLTRMQFISKEEEQMENLRKMFMAMAKDVRVILIKLCDRLHNMRTMMYQTDRKQKEKSRETMEIYAPIAHRLGMQRLKWELEDLSLQYLDPIGYSAISGELAARSSAHQEFLDSVRVKIINRLEEEGIKATVYGRVKHIYSIYRKMYSQNKTLDEIFDLYAFRVIVDDIPACYNVLGCIHDMCKPVLGRFKDYISTPKPNGYQSVHTTVIGREGIPFEVQIRTHDMHQTAEYGVAAHWKYKQGMANRKLGTEGTFEWMRKLLEAQQDADPEEFMSGIKVDMFGDEVFVFTPNGDVVNLPAQATPIDFAYSIHSAVGNSMVGAKVNGRMVPIDSTLHSGDIVEVITSKTARGPSRDWMKICKSTEARNKIRQWIKKERREENIVTGRTMFESELKHQGISLSAFVTNTEVVTTILKKARFNTLDDLYAAIGYGGVAAQKMVVRIKEELIRYGKLEKTAAQQRQLVEAVKASTGDVIFPSGARPPMSTKPRHSESGIIVEGLDNCLVKFSKCCSPVPGDPVIGFITRGFGVSVHRADCPNASPDRRKASEEGRWVNVSWVEGDQDGYRTGLNLSAKDRDNLALDVTMALSTLKVRVTTISARSQPDGYATMNLEVVVDNLEELTAVINKLGQIPGVFLVERAHG